MSDQPDEWWNSAGGASPAPPPPDGPAPQGPPPAAPQASPQPQADPDSTVVVPARHPGAPPADPGYGGTPAQYAPQGPPPGSPPPQYGGQPPPQAQPQQQYAGAPQHGAPPYGGPQYVQHGGPTSRYRAPFGSTMMLVGAVIAIAGTFLPWISFGGQSVNGYETYVIGDNFDSVAWSNPGAYVVAAMVVVIFAAVLVLAAGRRVVTWLIALLTTALGGLVAFAAFGAVGNVLDNLFAGSDLGIGVGVILCLLGAIIAGVGAIVVAVKSS